MNERDAFTRAGGTEPLYLGGCGDWQSTFPDPDDRLATLYETRGEAGTVRSEGAPHRATFVVGECFAGFAARHPNAVLTYSQFAARKESGQLYGLRLVAGQGLSPEEREVVFAVSSAGQPLALAGLHLVHKREVKNVMVSEPRWLSPSRFAFALLIDGRAAELSDHVTGEHIPALAVQEAGRQAVLAATEVSVCQPRAWSPSFVVKEWASSYRRPLFPIPASILLSVEHADISSPVRLSFHVRVDVVQRGIVAAELTFVFLLIDRVRFVAREHGLASAVLY